MKFWNHQLKKIIQTSPKKYVVYNNKLFQLVNNKTNGLRLFYSVRSFLNDQNISLGNDSFLLSVRNIRDKETFLESGILTSLLDYLSTLNETDFGELIQYADSSGEKVETCSHLNTIRT